MNPYAAYLAGDPPMEVLPRTAGRLSTLFANMSPEAVERPIAPGKWSPRQILCHLADCEIAFAFRLRQALAEPHHVIQPFDQDAWARSYSAYNPSAALDVFTALRRWNLAMVRAAGPAVFDQPVTHPERGTMTFGTILETMAGHDRNHLRQIEAASGISH